MAGWTSTVFAHESPTRVAGFDAENRLYLFALTVPRDAISGIIAVLNGHWPEYVVNPAAKAHARVQTWMRAA
jgi:hypothetical protein